MPDNAVSYLLADGYSDSVHVCPILHNIKYKLVVCSGFSPAIHFAKINILFKAFGKFHVLPFPGHDKLQRESLCYFN